MRVEALRPLWWLPGGVILLWLLLGGPAASLSASASAPVKAGPPRRPAQAALDKLRGRRVDPRRAAPLVLPGQTAASADEVIPLLLDWHGGKSHAGVFTLVRNLFAVEDDPFKKRQNALTADEQTQRSSWKSQGLTVAQAVLRQTAAFSCELRYGGDCPPPPAAPPTAPKFPYELIGVISIHHEKYASFHDPASVSGVIQARLNEKIGDTPFRVKQINLTSVEVTPDGFSSTEKLPFSTSASGAAPASP